jgi:hypothetical protein
MEQFEGYLSHTAWNNKVLLTLIVNIRENTRLASFEYSTPESQGIASQAIRGFVEEAHETIHDLHSFMLIRHGKLLAQGWWTPYEPDDPHVLFSLSKSFTSTAIGLAIEEGLLRLDAPVISFFPEALPDRLSENLAAMQVRHLLSMSTGHAEDTTAKLYEYPNQTWVKTFLSLPVEYQPGTHFLYNTGATYMLSAILQKVTGQTLLEYLRPRLFEPLGVAPHSWENSPEGINTGGFGLAMKTAGIAAFGQLYLQKGRWNGQPILTEEWVKAATSKQTETTSELNPDWVQGYGYQFWRCRNGAYRGDGAFGQFCVVLPEQDAVLAITSGVEDMQSVLNLVWKYLLPAMQPHPLPENLKEQQLLEQKLSKLEIEPAKSLVKSSVASWLSGKTFSLSENEQHLKNISFDFTSAGCTLTIENRLGNSQVLIGDGAWLTSVTTLDGFGPRKVSASGGWVSEDTYTIKLYFLTPVLSPHPPLHAATTTPAGLTITYRFDEAGLTVYQEASQSFLPKERPTITGQLSGAQASQNK